VEIKQYNSSGIGFFSLPSVGMHRQHLLAVTVHLSSSASTGPATLQPGLHHFAVATTLAAGLPLAPCIMYGTFKLWWSRRFGLVVHLLLSALPGPAQCIG
jgi:hypothetical protein